MVSGWVGGGGRSESGGEEGWLAADGRLALACVGRSLGRSLPSRAATAALLAGPVPTPGATNAPAAPTNTPAGASVAAAASSR